MKVLLVLALLAGPAGIAGVGALGLIAVASSGAQASASPAIASAACIVGIPTGDAAAAPGLDAEQAANARVFVTEAVRRGLPVRAAVIAVAAGLVESEMRNLPYGHGTSVGVLQLIDDHGSAAQRLDPLFSVTWFYDGLVGIPGWEIMSVGDAAQAQQRSAYPLAYREREAEAGAIVSALSGGVDTGVCQPLAPGEWTVPVPAGAYSITSGYGRRSSPGGIGSTNHQGLDFAAPTGTPALAATSGRVRSAGPGGGYGNLVVLDHADGVSTYYAHLSSLGVTPGQAIAPGQPVGAVGNTGRSTGSHLHFEVRVADVPTDPRPWLLSHGVTL